MMHVMMTNGPRFHPGGAVAGDDTQAAARYSYGMPPSPPPPPARRGGGPALGRDETAAREEAGAAAAADVRGGSGAAAASAPVAAAKPPGPAAGTEDEAAAKAAATTLGPRPRPTIVPSVRERTELQPDALFGDDDVREAFEVRRMHRCACMLAHGARQRFEAGVADTAGLNEADLASSDEEGGEGGADSADAGEKARARRRDLLRFAQQGSLISWPAAPAVAAAARVNGKPLDRSSPRRTIRNRRGGTARTGRRCPMTPRWSCGRAACCAPAGRPCSWPWRCTPTSCGDAWSLGGRRCERTTRCWARWWTRSRCGS